MRKYAKRQTKHNQEILLIHTLRILVRSDSEMLSWPNSPLLVLLQFVDPNVLLVCDEQRYTLLHQLADLADYIDYSTHQNQLILAKQLIERGANVNAVSIPDGATPLHRACYERNVTNLDFVVLLLEGSRCRFKCPRSYWDYTVDVYHPACFRCGQISAELAYHGRQYYHAIWGVRPGQGSILYHYDFQQNCRL